MSRRRKADLMLLTLNAGQIAQAKAVNGKRKQITHALLCGPHGQMFGTEAKCLKYYQVWKDIFPKLFAKAYQTDNYEVADFRSTFNLVNILIDADERC